MNWTAFFTIVIAVYILAGVIIPFGRVLVYSSKWNTWYKWINYINKNHSQEEGKKPSPSHVHNYDQKPKQ